MHIVLLTAFLDMPRIYTPNAKLHGMVRTTSLNARGRCFPKGAMDVATRVGHVTGPRRDPSHRESHRALT